MLEVNEFLVLDYVRDHDPTTRTDIGRSLGLSPASVSRIVGRLRDDGLVREEGISFRGAHEVASALARRMIAAGETLATRNGQSAGVGGGQPGQAGCRGLE